MQPAPAASARMPPATAPPPSVEAASTPPPPADVPLSPADAPVPPGASAGQPEIASGAVNGAPSAVSSGAGPALELDSLRAVWPAVIDTVRTENALCAALLEDTTPIAIDGVQVTVAFPPGGDFLRRKANDDGYRQCVATAVRTVTGAKAQIAYVLAEAPPADADESLADAPPTDDEWVRRLVSEFDAEEIIPDLDPGPPTDSEAR